MERVNFPKQSEVKNQKGVKPGKLRQEDEITLMFKIRKFLTLLGVMERFFT